jgi:hypothetical protein
MAIGVYSTTKLANLNIERDVSIYYHYRPNRNTVDPSFGESFKTASSTELLTPSTVVDTARTTRGVGNVLNGIYSLNLPLSIFYRTGIYTIVIAPREVYTKITDSPAILSVLPDVQGIVIDSNSLGANLTVDNNELVGYRVDYYNNDGSKTDYFRIVTSNGFVEPVASNLSNVSQKSISYRYNDSGSLIFCTVSPSSASSNRPSVLPFIGVTNQTICLVNPKFNAQVVEVEFVNNDMETIATLISGTQALDLDRGLLTTYNANNDILSQVEVIQNKNSYTGTARYNLRILRSTNIDTSQAYNTIFQGVN